MQKNFTYIWKNKEANFGKPLARPVKGGMHITIEIIPKWMGNYVALRRKSIPGHESPPHAQKHPNGLLYFCHDLIRYGEALEQSVKRIVKAQTGVGIRSCQVVYLDSYVQKQDFQWAVTPHVIAELSTKPKVGTFGNRIIEVVQFTKRTIPSNFAWWSKKDLESFLKEFD